MRWATIEKDNGGWWNSWYTVRCYVGPAQFYYQHDDLRCFMSYRHAKRFASRFVKYGRVGYAERINPDGSVTLIPSAEKFGYDREDHR